MTSAFLWQCLHNYYPSATERNSFFFTLWMYFFVLERDEIYSTAPGSVYCEYGLPFIRHSLCISPRFFLFVGFVECFEEQGLVTTCASTRLNSVPTLQTWVLKDTIWIQSLQLTWAIISNHLSFWATNYT